MNTTQRWVLVLTAIGSLMVALDALVVSTALNTIRLHFGASLGELEWTVNAYNLSFAVLMMTAAVLGDRYGRRRLYAIGLALFAAASAACALAPGIGWLIAARAVQGVGAALVVPVGLAMLTAAFARERRGTALGIYSAITGLAVASGPFVGGAIVQGLSWQWIFWLNVPIGLAALPLVLRRLPESFGGHPVLDVRGLALISLAAFGVVWGLMRGNDAGWGSPEVVTSLAGGLALSGVFVAAERRASSPMLPLGLFRSRAFAAGNAAIFFVIASLFGAVFFLAQYFQTGLGYGPLATGVRLMPWTATFMIVAPVAGAMTDRIGERTLMVGGLLLQALGMAWLALIASPHLAYGRIVLPLVIAGCGISMAIPSAQKSVVGAVSLVDLGKATGTNSMMRELGGVFGIALLAAVFAGAGSYASPQAFTDGFGPALGATAVLAVIGASIGLALPGRERARAVRATATHAVPALDGDAR